MMKDKIMIEREINRKRNMESSILFGYDPSKLERNHPKNNNPKVKSKTTHAKSTSKTG